LQNAGGQPGLAQAVLALQMLAQEIAKWVTHTRVLLTQSICVKYKVSMI
jgi:hypothetical protein